MAESQGTCTVVVDQVAEHHYRATCHLFPDCETFAATGEEARQSLEEAIHRIVRERSNQSVPGSPVRKDRFHEPH